jgi:hypothetical protein
MCNNHAYVDLQRFLGRTTLASNEASNYHEFEAVQFRITVMERNSDHMKKFILISYDLETEENTLVLYQLG